MASRIHLPTFFQVAGADCLCDQEGARRFFRRIPVARKQLKIYDGFSHEIYNEVERETVFADMERWITEMLQDERIVAHPVEARRPLAVGPSAVAAGTVEIGSL
ncbi:MAG: alpha/beta hydrolase [Deltaproteobacteria bacterium]|nr:alpha/beta hydrolase [Deltaproteobacteria bacterium]